MSFRSISRCWTERSIPLADLLLYLRLLDAGVASSSRRIVTLNHDSGSCSTTKTCFADPLLGERFVGGHSAALALCRQLGAPSWRYDGTVRELWAASSRSRSGSRDRCTVTAGFAPIRDSAFGTHSHILYPSCLAPVLFSEEPSFPRSAGSRSLRFGARHGQIRSGRGCSPHCHSTNPYPSRRASDVPG